MGSQHLGLSALFAATCPERIVALVLSSVAPQGGSTLTPELRAHFFEAVQNSWGDGTLLSVFVPSQVGNRLFSEWWGRMQRFAASPGMARQLMEMISQTDCAPCCGSRRWSPTSATTSTFRSPSAARWRR